jgi:hypothetical protein
MVGLDDVWHRNNPAQRFSIIGNDLRPWGGPVGAAPDGIALARFHFALDGASLPRFLAQPWRTLNNRRRGTPTLMPGACVEWLGCATSGQRESVFIPQQLREIWLKGFHVPHYRLFWSWAGQVGA